MLHLPRQRGGTRCRQRQSDLEDVHDSAGAAANNERVRAVRSCGGRRAAAVWSQPAVDAERNRIYITTGDSYSNPPAPESDAIMALAMDTGRVLWIQQTLAGDAWNVGCLETGAGRVTVRKGRDPTTTSRSSPSIGVLPDGKRIIIAGQKSGAMFGIDPETR